jgi:hypothetical protein
MLGWKSQGNNYALRQYNADGSNERVPVIAAGEIEWCVVPQKSIILLSLFLNPAAGCTATVDLCFDHIADVNAQLASGFSGANTLIWVPSGLGNITSASPQDNKELFWSGGLSAIRIAAVGGGCPVRGVL